MIPEPVSAIAPPLRGPLVSTNSWLEISFLHWAIDPDRVAGMLPGGVVPDVYDGRTYVGLVPFRMVDTGLWRSPGIPYFGTFLETNVRLYTVDETGRRGVHFLCLQTSRWVIVPAIRWTIGVPYTWARMRLDRDGQRITYASRSRGRRDAAETTIGIVVGDPRASTPLDEFLTARWCAHVDHRGRTTYVANSHEPWRLHQAEVTELRAGLLAEVGFPELVGRAPDLVAYSDGVHARFDPPRRVDHTRVESGSRRADP